MVWAHSVSAASMVTAINSLIDSSKLSGWDENTSEESFLKFDSSGSWR